MNPGMTRKCRWGLLINGGIKSTNYDLQNELIMKSVIVPEDLYVLEQQVLQNAEKTFTIFGK